MRTLIFPAVIALLASPVALAQSTPSDPLTIPTTRPNTPDVDVEDDVEEIDEIEDDIRGEERGTRDDVEPATLEEDLDKDERYDADHPDHEDMDHEDMGRTEDMDDDWRTPTRAEEAGVQSTVNLFSQYQIDVANLPPAGTCRVWQANVPAAEQLPPMYCADAWNVADEGNYLIEQPTDQLTIIHVVHSNVKSKGIDLDL